MATTLAYYDTATITAVKNTRRFIVKFYKVNLLCKTLVNIFKSFFLAFLLSPSAISSS
jgi:hypothetical protein